jgi:hypothetical protein
MLRRLLLPVVALLVVAGVGLGAWAIFRSSGPGKATGTLLVAQTASLATSQPDGTHQVPIVTAGFSSAGASVSADGNYLLSGQGALLAFHNGVAGQVSEALFDGMSAAGPDSLILTNQPFVDGDRFVAFSADFNDNTGASKIFLIPRAGGKPVPIGGGLDYAGDPTRDGVYVVQPGPSGGEQAEYRTGTGASAVLATQAQLAADLGLPATGSYNVFVTSDADGGKVAVQVDSATVGGVVVLSRSGALLAHENVKTDSPVFFAPSGNALVYSTSAGTELWQLTKAPRPVTGLAGTAVVNYCAWAPDGAHVACATFPKGTGSINGWALIDAGGATGRLYPAAGAPLFWRK